MTDNPNSNTRSKHAPIIAFLLQKGCRVKSIDTSGYLFERNLDHLVRQFKAGDCVVNARDYANELDQVTQTLIGLSKLFKSASALFGESSPKQRPQKA